jgi:hypothetical protein
MSLRPWAEKPQGVIAKVQMCEKMRFILVEGVTDYRFLKSHMGHRLVIETLGNRAEVHNVVRALEQRGANNFVGLVDADFDHVVGLNKPSPRLVYVSISDDGADSTIDLESTLLRTRALRQLCGDALANRIRDFGGPAKFADDMRESLRAAAAAVGAFRAAVKKIYADRRSIQGIGELSEDDWAAFVDLVTGEIDHERLDAVIHTKVENTLKFPEVRQRARDYALEWGHGWLLCRGHDMTRLLALRLSRLRGRPIEQREVERTLLKVYDGRLVTETAFGRQLKIFCAN